MEILKELPIEIKRIIFSFGYAQYRKYLKTICYTINFKRFRFNYNTDLLNNDITRFYDERPINFINMYPLRIIILMGLSNNRQVKLFNQCIKCCCCTKHCNRRPSSIHRDVYTYTENYDDDPICECSCRQNARYIKEMYNQTEYYKKHLPSEIIDYYTQNSDLNNLFIE